jgi:hypothetical protein
MARNPDDGLVSAGKLIRRTKEADLRDDPEHKRWVRVLGGADLPARLLDDVTGAERSLKRSELAYSTKELSPISPLAPIPEKKDVVLYTLQGKVVGYAVGATPLNNTR